MNISYNKKRILLFSALNILVLAASLVYNCFFERGAVGNCVFLSVFGFYCPGCGGSRSLNALLNFNPLRSFIYYPPIIITSLILLYTDIMLVISTVKNEKRIIGLSYKIFLLIPVSIIIQFALKNVLLLFKIDLLGNVL